MFSTILLQFIIFFLPTQLGLHFWPDFSRAVGIKIDYLSPALYFTDILLFIYLLLSLRPISIWLKNNFKDVSLFLLFILINLFFAISPLNSFFWWLRNLLYLLFFLSLRLQRITWTQIKTPLLLSTLMIISLEFFQLISQSSLGGLFYWLGERHFSSSTPGIGRVSWFGLDLVRPQSTFSHPNSLSGYLLVVYFLFQKYSMKIWTKLLVFAGLLMTLSKGALLAFFLVFIFPVKSIFLIIFFLVLSLLQFFLPQISVSYQFISDRLFLLLPTSQIISNSSFFGVGLGNFVPALARLLPGSFLVLDKLQPVHNLPLLVFSEIGLLGIALLTLFLMINRRRLLKTSILGLLSLIILTGTFDHYWWTLAQNKLILLLALSILL